MPLHLLGKKSWHVYNTANVERVRRDEAAAQAKEEAEEQRMQEEDASRRIAILRGERPAAAGLPPPPAADETAGIRHVSVGQSRKTYPRERKRRRLRDEDDTAREIRYAREDAEAGQQARRALEQTHATHARDADAPIVDRAGHLQLIPLPDEQTLRKAEKNAEVEAEKAKKRKREEAQVTMKFSNAAGYQQGTQKPWYASNKHAGPQSASAGENKSLVLTEVHDKDVWGNDDPRRKDRERSRISSSDPFAAMQTAQRQLKQSTKDKEKWEQEQQRELEKLKREQRREREHRHRRKHKSREQDDGNDSLEGFDLDAPPEVRSERKSEHRHRRRRSRSRSLDRHSHRRRSHHA